MYQSIIKGADSNGMLCKDNSSGDRILSGKEDATNVNIQHHWRAFLKTY
jgi:hypothetical protein